MGGSGAHRPAAFCLQGVSTAAIYLHEKWSGDSHDGYDIAVLKLDEAFDLPVPTLVHETRHFDARQEFTAVGWGRDSNDRKPSRLQMANSLRYLSNDVCGKRLHFEDSLPIICEQSPHHAQDSCKGCLLHERVFIERSVSLFWQETLEVRC